MKSHLALVVVAALAAFGLGAISCQQSTVASLPFDLDDPALGGKADDWSKNVEVTEVMEDLTSEGLRWILCKQIADHNGYQGTIRHDFEYSCVEQTFTVTEVAKSNIYAYLNSGEAVTLGLRVMVDTKTGSYETLLRRELHPDFRLRWRATVMSQGNYDELIKQLADDTGEYFDYANTSWEEYIQPVGRADVPAELLTITDGRLNDLDLGEGNGASYSDEGFFAIVQDGARIGYVIGFEYDIDDPLFDGGGLWLFLSLEGRVIAETEWWG